jgi:cytochrome c6
MRTITADGLKFAVLAAALSVWAAAPSRAQSAGEKVYKAKCAMCHGPDGKGETPAGKATKARDFNAEDVKKETDEEWTEVIVKGKNKMPSYDKKLKEDEIKELVKYIRTLK